MASDGRVVLITGAAGGLGRVAALGFARAGANLALAGSTVDRVAEVGRSLGIGEDRWMPVAGDLRSAGAAKAVAGAVAERFGRIDVLVHLVGGWVGGTRVADLDASELGSMLDQHLWTALHVVQAVVPGMVDRGWGRVVVASSPSALQPSAGGASYAIAKAAEETLVRTLAREVANTGVTANVLSIKAIDTGHERERAPREANAAWATPEEIAAAILFLCSDAAAAVNGVRLPLDGRG